MRCFTVFLCPNMVLGLQPRYTPQLFTGEVHLGSKRCDNERTIIYQKHPVTESQKLGDDFHAKTFGKVIERYHIGNDSNSNGTAYALATDDTKIV